MFFSSLRRPRGTTLVEAIMASALLGLIVMFTIAPLSASDKASAKVSTRQALVSLATELMDQSQTCSPSRLQSQSDTGQSDLSIATANGPESVRCVWKRSVSLVEAPRTYKIEILVSVEGTTPFLLSSQRCLIEAQP